MNRVIITGRLTADPKVTYSTGDKPTCIAKFNLAVDRKYKRDGEPNADFINCTAFGKTAELVEKYVVKGSKVGVEGHIQTGSYTNKDGQKVYTTDVMAEAIEFLERKSDGAANQSEEKFTAVDDSELPFG